MRLSDDYTHPDNIQFRQPLLKTKAYINTLIYVYSFVYYSSSFFFQIRCSTRVHELTHVPISPRLSQLPERVIVLDHYLCCFQPIRGLHTQRQGGMSLTDGGPGEKQACSLASQKQGSEGTRQVADRSEIFEMKWKMRLRSRVRAVFI